MLSTLRSLTRLIAWIAGVGLLVASAAWLKARSDIEASSLRLELAWILCATVSTASALFSAALTGLIRDRNRREQEALERTGVFEASASAPHLILLIGFCLMFGVGAWAALRGDQVGWALLSLGLLVLMIVLAWSLLRQIWRKGPMLRIDRHGIDHALHGPIPWEDVIGLSLQTIRMKHQTVQTLLLGVRNPYRYLRQASGPAQWLNEHRFRYASFGSLPIPLNALGKEAEHIHHCARTLRETHTAPFLLHWHPDMSDSEIAAWLESQTLHDELRDIFDEFDATDLDERPEAMAQLDTRLKAHAARSEALRPHLWNAVDASYQRVLRDRKILWVMLAIGAFLLLLRIVT